MNPQGPNLGKFSDQWPEWASDYGKEVFHQRRCGKTQDLVCKDLPRDALANPPRYLGWFFIFAVCVSHSVCYVEVLISLVESNDPRLT